MRKQKWFPVFLSIAAMSILVASNAFADDDASNTNRMLPALEKTNQEKNNDESVIADQSMVADKSAVADQKESAGPGEDPSQKVVVDSSVIAGRNVIANQKDVAKGLSEEGDKEPGEIEKPETKEDAFFSLLPSEKTEAVEAGEEVEKPTGVTTNLISISFDRVPVPDVVDMFSRISGANIIVAGTFTNLFVTANLKNVEWNSALNLVLGSVNLSTIKDPSGIIMVVTSEMYQEKLKQIEETKPLVTRVFKAQYLNAVDLVEQIKKMKILSQRGSIITSQSKEQHTSYLKSSLLGTETIQNPSITTEIIITDIKEYVNKVGRLIKQLDKREPQVFIEARIIDVVSSDSKKLGFDWKMLDSFGVSAGLRDVKWSWSDSHSVDNTKANKDSLYDNRAYNDNINLQYDLDGNRYEESTTTYEESPPDSGNWVARTAITPTRSIKDTISQGRDITSDYSDTVADTLAEGKTASAILTASDVSLFLSALEQTTDADMISHPLIIVGNRVEAKIHVGERYPTVFSEKGVDKSGGAITDTYSEKVEWNDLGLTLWVIPEIDLKVDMVRLSVSPQMSSWIKDVTTPQGSVFPVISTRHLSTRVNVPSKHTVVIGGLIENKKGKIERRVPFLGDIPLLGLLFRYTEDIDEKHNLIIMMTVTILDEDAPLTGMEGMGMQIVEKFEKIPLSPKEAVAPVDVMSTNVAEQASTVTAEVSSPETPTDEEKETPAAELPAE